MPGLGCGVGHLLIAMVCLLPPVDHLKSATTLWVTPAVPGAEPVSFASLPALQVSPPPLATCLTTAPSILTVPLTLDFTPAVSKSTKSTV